MCVGKPLPVLLGSILLSFVAYNFSSLSLSFARDCLRSVREQICIRLITVLKLYCTFRLSSVSVFASWHQFRNVKDPHLMALG
jgi:hypothetical protein